MVRGSVVDRTPQSSSFVTKSLVCRVSVTGGPGYTPVIRHFGLKLLHTYVRKLHRFGYFCRIPTHTVKNRDSLGLDGLHGRENALERLWVGNLSISI